MTKKKPLDPEQLRQTIGSWKGQGQIGKEWVFQGCDPRFSNLRDVGDGRRMMRRYVVPNDPKTPPQMSWREYYRLGTQEWNSLSDAEKAEYNRRAKKKLPLIGFNLFMREWLNNAPMKRAKGKIRGKE